MDKYTHIYPELQGIQVRYNEAPPPEIPAHCPHCGAPVSRRIREGEWVEVHYDCGGAYVPKPQIQNHTRKWWGECPDNKNEGK